jgi:surface antigen
MVRESSIKGSFKLAVLIGSCVLALGCATKRQTGGLVGAGAGAAAGAAIAKNDAVGAIVGGLVGGLVGSEIGRRMDLHDQQQLAQTFEHGQTGRTSTWVNPDTGHRYAATPTDTYEIADRPCRKFRLETDLEGPEEETVYGTACRRSDGTWELTS